MSLFAEEFRGKCSDGFNPATDLQRLGVINQTTMLATETQEIADFFKQVMINKFGEADLKNHFADKTNWRKMLTNDIVFTDLIIEREKLQPLLPNEVQEYFHLEKNDLYEMNYPVLEYPSKINSLSLDKTTNFKGKLIGIKGQYLIFEDGTVFNVRSNEGYIVRIEV